MEVQICVTSRKKYSLLHIEKNIQLNSLERFLLRHVYKYVKFPRNKYHKNLLNIYLADCELL